jgi:alpha-tubulin suppressor-like RCC1 family protein
MSQEKAQLIAPQGHFTVPGLNVAGVVTASSFSGDCTGTASSITKGSNVVVGVMTASSFAGDVFGNAAGLSTTTAGLKLGIVTSTSFAGNFTGIGSGLTGTPNIVAGLVTASQFVGNTPGLAGGISAGKNLHAGIVTATTFYGDGSNLTGAGSTAFIRQSVTAQAGTTTINLNDGNVIYFTHSNNTTIAFSNVPASTNITIIRTLTDNTITWPAAITWNGGTAPTLTGANSYSLTGQVFNLTTADAGTTWYGYEEVDNNLSQPHSLWTWGTSYKGALGLNSQDPYTYSSPVQIPGTNWSGDIGASNSGGLSGAIKTDGTLWTWGQNGFGELGQNNLTEYSSPIQIPGTTWASRQGTRFSRGAIKTDGTLYTWGGFPSGHGPLMHNNRTLYSSPTQVPGTTWTFWGGDGYETSIATKSDNTLWTAGSNHGGQLGQNNRTAYSSPVQIPGTTWKVNYTSVGCANGAFCAIKTDGTLWSLGYNNYGMLGQNSPSPSHRSSPVQIPGTSWSVVQGCSNAFAAIRTDGTLWAWGRNNQGQVGQNNETEYSSPVQIPGTTWSKLSTSHHSKFWAIKTDNTLWSWGYNNGNFASNTPQNTHYSSPTQIPGTDWIDVQGNYAGGAIATKEV